MIENAEAPRSKLLIPRVVCSQPKIVSLFCQVFSALSLEQSFPKRKKKFFVTICASV